MLATYPAAVRMWLAVLSPKLQASSGVYVSLEGLTWRMEAASHNVIEAVNNTTPISKVEAAQF